MILNVMMHKNTKINCFTQPIFTDIEPEKFAIQESRSIQIAEKGELILPYKYLDLYFVGIFNDETGEFILVDEEGNSLLRKILKCKELVEKRLEELGWTKKEKEGVIVNA